MLLLARLVPASVTFAPMVGVRSVVEDPGAGLRLLMDGSVLAPTTLTGAENSEVLPRAPSVAVAVMLSPAPTGADVASSKEALPLPSVVTLVSPIRVLPSSVPAGLEKNWTRK